MKTIRNVSWMVCLTLVIGCGPSETPSVQSPSEGAAGSLYVTTDEPANVTPVGDARKVAKDGDGVTLLGNIGGTVKPFVNGIAAFTIVDPKVNCCPPEEGCPTPWDYCCKQSEVKENIATVKFVNDQGRPISQDARTLLGVKELSLVVIEGTAKRDAEGNLSVLAGKVFVKKR